MKWLASVIDLACTANEIFWLYQWVNLLLQKKSFVMLREKRGIKIEYVLYALYVGLVFCMNRVVLTSPYTMVVVMAINFVAVLCCWNGDLIHVFAVVGGYFFALFLKGNLEILVTGIIGGDALIQATTGEQGLMRVIYLSVCGSALFVLNMCLIRFIKRRGLQTKGIRYLSFISVIGIIGSVFLANFMLGSFDIHISLVWYIFVGSLLVATFLFVIYVKRKELQMRMELLKAQNEMLEQNYMQVNEFYTRNAKLYHDMNHHFDAIYHMLQSDENERAKDYLKSLRAAESKEDYKYQAKSGINVIDAVLCEASRKAHEKGINYTEKISMLPYNLGIESTDLCSILANLLTNALEAAQQEMFVELKKVRETLFITVKNDYETPPVVVNGKFVTHKKEKSLHGWGTQIVEQIVEKYEGSVEYTVSERYFAAYVMLNEKDSVGI